MSFHLCNHGLAETTIRDVVVIVSDRNGKEYRREGTHPYSGGKHFNGPLKRGIGHIINASTSIEGLLPADVIAESVRVILTDSLGITHPEFSVAVDAAPKRPQ